MTDAGTSFPLSDRGKQFGVLAATCALVIGVYAYMAHPGFLPSTSLNAADTYYNLLVQGFRSGQLSLKKAVPPGFAQLADPYDRTANTPYGVLDLSYYKGKFYLYFGVTPAVVLFWPYVALTVHYLSQKDAAVIFCVVGFLASVGLLRALWRRYFAEASVGVVAAGALALGLTTGTPFLLALCDVYEVPITCGYALTMLALAAIWKVLHESEPRRRSVWLAVASVAYGLAVGARPSLLFGAVILLVPVVQVWGERRKILAPLLAAIGPIVLIGLGLMLYNARRFDSPCEFGQHYQLAGDRAVARQFFGLRNLWFNFRVYFLELARWSGRFPFVHDIRWPPLPVGYNTQVRKPFGVLTNIPLVWLALAVPLAWRGRLGQARSVLRWFIGTTVLLFGMCTLTLGLFCSSSFRYEADFLPTLLLLAVVGILGLERMLSHQLAWRRAGRCGWGLLLGFSVAFNLLVSVDRCAEADYNLGSVLSLQGRLPEAVAQYERALRLNPDYAEAHINLGVALVGLGRKPEAVEQWEQALRSRPDDAKAHNNLGVLLRDQGRVPEATAHFVQALRLKPDFAEAHFNLGAALAQRGRLPEAIGHYEQTLRLEPDLAEAHCALGIALELSGRVREAIGQYEQALRIKPDYAQAQNGLARLQAGQ